MNDILNEASRFFYDHFGHTTEGQPLNVSVEPREQVACALCGATGPGVYDGRSNMQKPLCKPCWSFYQNSPRHFPKVTKDRSFSGKVQTPWIVDTQGMRIYTSPTDQERNVPDIQYVARRGNIMGAILQDILDGVVTPPFLWGKFSKKKEECLTIIEVTRSLSRVIFCDGKSRAQTNYNMVQIGEALAHLDARDNPKEVPKVLQRWRYGDDIQGKCPRLDIKKGLRESGYDDRILMPLSLGERQAIGQILDNRKEQAKADKLKARSVHPDAASSVLMEHGLA